MSDAVAPRYTRLLALDFTLTAVTEIDKASGRTRQLVTGLGGRPDGIAVDHRRARIYWTNMGADFDADDGSVNVMAFDGSGQRQLLGGDAVRTGKQLVLSGDGTRLYWCDREGGRVMSCRHDGSERHTLVQRPRDAQDRVDILDQCVGVAVDEVAGYVYWSQKGPSRGGRGRLFRAPLTLPAGQRPDTRTDIVCLLDGLPEPIDLLLDTAAGLLYWTDRGAPPAGNSLNCARVTASGLTEHRILCTGFGDAIGLTHEPETGHMYVADHMGAIHRITLATGARERIHQGGGYTGIAQY